MSRQSLSSEQSAPPTVSPLLPGNAKAYRDWRAKKLDRFPRSVEALRVAVQDPRRLSATEQAAITACCAAANMAVYVSPLAGVADKAIAHELGLRLGLTDLDHNPLADDDSISALQVMPGKSVRGYIPYSNRRLLWHTDGYYNPPERRIHAFVLHCVRPAAEGGENALLDHEMAYLMLRDTNPDFIEALMHPQAMTIPPNTEDAAQNRGAQSGPVFAIDAATGALHMRYTARTRSIVWRDDATTRAAVACLAELLESDNPYVFRYRLRAGEGLVCNNVLHNRTGFNDAPAANETRLMYRARYYNRVAGT